jgi:hypothetical protein
VGLTGYLKVSGMIRIVEGWLLCWLFAHFMCPLFCSRLSAIPTVLCSELISLANCLVVVVAIQVLLLLWCMAFLSSTANLIIVVRIIFSKKERFLLLNIALLSFFGIR